MRYCTHCGQEVPDGYPYCPSCGQELRVQQMPRGQQPRPAPAAYEEQYWDELPPQVPPKKSNLPLILLVALLALLLIGTAVWFFVLRDSEDEDASGGGEQTEQAEPAAEEPAISFAPDTPIAASVAFDRRTEGGSEYAVITGADATGKALWKVETPHYGLSQLNRVTGLDVRNNVYYYIDDGAVVALSLADGSEVWRNPDYKGSPASGAWAFDANGTLYLTGYLGPDLIVISPQGKTLQRWGEFHSDYYWPYKLQLLDGGGAQITYEMGPGESEGILTVNVQTGEVLGAEGANAASDTPPAASSAGVTVTASSTLQEKGHDHSPRLVMDGSTATAWVEGASGFGASEWIRLDLGGTRTLSAINIWNGYQKSESLFYKNCRPQVIRITFSDGSSFETTLADQMGMQTITLSAPTATSSVTITIVSAYSGSTYSDTCISEIQLY